MQPYLEKVRALVLPRLTPAEARRCKAATLRMEPRFVPTDLYQLNMVFGAVITGRTLWYKPPVVLIYQQASDGRSLHQMGYTYANTLVHELGHVIVGEAHGHDEVWAECCQRMGLQEVAYGGSHARKSTQAPFDLEMAHQITVLGEEDVTVP